MKKSLLMGLILTFFFGPLGMLYSTVMGAIVMFFVCLLGVGITVATMGMGILLFIFVIWPLQLLWTWLAICGHNSKTDNLIRNQVQPTA